MARILITIEGKPPLRVAAAYVRGNELDAGQVEAIEESDELVALVALLQRVAPHELDYWGPLERPAPGEPSVPEKYNVALHDAVVLHGTEFRRLADVVGEVDSARCTELADDADTLTEAARYVSERANDEAQADAESEAE